MDNNGTENNSNGGWNGSNAMPGAGAGETPVMANNEAQSVQNGTVTNDVPSGVAGDGAAAQGGVSDGGMPNNGAPMAGNDQPGMNNMMVNNSQPQPQPQMNMVGGMAMGGAPAASQKKSNGKLIAIIVAVVAVLVVVIVALVIVLMNNNKSSKSQGGKGGSHYEEDDETGKNDKDDEDDDWYGNGGSSDAESISCLGYQFEKRSGYNYVCHGSDGLEVSGTTFVMFVEVTSGMSYYQAEGHAAELKEQLGRSATVRSYRTYTTSGGRKMLVFDANYDGVDMYIFISAASSSSVLVVQVANTTGRPTTADLEIAASLLGDSSRSSRLPEDEGDSGDVPEVDWNLQVPEL